MDRIEGFNEFIEEIGGWEKVDYLGSMERMELAFAGGRKFEMEKDLERREQTIIEAATILNQAE